MLTRDCRDFLWCIAMQKYSNSAFHGTVLVVATIVGGGMFALPIALEALWFTKGVLFLLLSALFMLASGLMLVDVNMRFPQGSSFHTFTKKLLGRKVNFIVGLSLVFVLYLVTYAYLSGASAVFSTLQSDLTGKRYPVLSVMLITLFVSAVVCKGGRFSAHIISFFIAAKFTAFFMATAGHLHRISPELVFTSPAFGSFSAILLTLPVCIISFGFHGSIPSLIKMYGGKEHKLVVKSLCFGVGISALIYIYWLGMTMGILDRGAFAAIKDQGGNINVFMTALSQNELSHYINGLLLFFAFFAVTSSLLSASLGLFDYLHDLLGSFLGITSSFPAAAMTYLPPALLCIITPDGFIPALAYAGIALVIWSVLLPPLLLLKARKAGIEGPYQFPAGNKFLYGYFLSGFLLWVAMLVNMIKV